MTNKDYTMNEVETTTTSVMRNKDDSMNEIDVPYVSKTSLILVAMGILILIVTIVMIGWLLKRRQRNRAAYSTHSEAQLGNINESFQFMQPQREILTLASSLTNERGSVAVNRSQPNENEEIEMEELTGIY